MLPILLHKRTYLFLTVIVTLPMLFFAYVNAKNTRALLLKTEEQKLMAIAAILEQRLPKPFHELLAAEGLETADTLEQLRALNRRLQPIIDDIGSAYQGYGLGYYSHELNIIAVQPLKPELLGQPAHAQSLQVYREKKALFNEIDTGITQEGKPLLALNYPLFRDGKLIGHVWANARLEDVDQTIALTIARNLFIVFLFWISIITCIYWAFHKIDLSLAEFAHQVRTETADMEKFREFPQLIPILETVIQLREDLKQQYHIRQIDAELAKVDRLNLVSQMAAGVAHEIRNPMTVVMGYIQMMALKADEKARRQFDLVMQELNTINEITTDFLYVARNKSVVKKACQLNDIVKSHYQLIHANTIKNGIKMELQLDETLPEFECDRKEMSQLILNLTRNAAEAMPYGGKLTVTTRAGSDFAELRVTDTGPGIPPDLRERIFDPFFTTKNQGTGLGLSICKGITERHGGEISAENQANGGAVFLIRFPYKSLLNS